jgi:hypothetical protein
VPLDVLGGGDPGAGGVQTAYCVTNGGEEHCNCSDFTGCAYKLIAGGTGAKLVCKTGTGDPACSAVVPPSTTSTSTTTTTSSSTTTTLCVATSGTFCDLGDGIVYDSATGLMWEQKDTAAGSGVDAGNLHDVDNQYAWTGRCPLNLSVSCQPNSAAAATCTTQTGGAFGCGECGVGEGTCDVALSITTVWDWVNQVNAASYAGHTDWRLPTSAGCCGFPTGEAGELESIVYLGAPGCGGGSPCIDSIFGPTLTTWSASTSSISPDEAWFLNFSIGAVISNSKDFDFLARAVRPSS